MSPLQQLVPTANQYTGNAWGGFCNGGSLQTPTTFPEVVYSTIPSQSLSMPSPRISVAPGWTVGS